MRRLAVLALGSAVLFTAGCKGLRSSPADGGTSGGGGFMSALATLVGFEGEIDFSITMPGPASTTLKMKGDKMRMEFGGIAGAAAGTSGATIVDGAAKKTYTLMPATKEYLETDLSALPSSPPAAGTPKAKATNTGRTDKVAGYSCDIWTITSPGLKVDSELCVAHGLTFLAMGVGPFAGLGTGGDAWGEALNGGGFPLRMRVFDTPGHEMMHMEATRVEKKSEPDSLFEIPAGYTKYGTTYRPTGPPSP
ncbi:MAG TPA: DUF4412 domain-containing protein [Polyangiaceae bacterium]